jgi:hypothetical protein
LSAGESRTSRHPPTTRTRRSKFDEITTPGTVGALLDMDAMGGMKGSRDVEETHVLGKSTIELFFFLAKARKIWDFFFKH